jgi:putative ABC transport system substrate-binding protein
VSRGREFAVRRALLGAAALAALAPVLPMARTAGRTRIVLMGFAEMFDGPAGLEGVVKTLAERGIVDGRQVEFVRVAIPAVAEEERGRGFAYLVPKIEELVLPRKPDIIVTVGTIMTKGASLATKEIPIVGSVADPVDVGVARSLARPGMNVTGVANGAVEVAIKTVEFMKLLVPRATRVAIFHEGRQMAARFAGHYERAARSIGLEPVMIASIDPAEMLREIRSLPARRIQAGLWTWAAGSAPDVAREAMGARVPMVCADESFTEAGLLASYSVLQQPIPPRLAAAVEQILRGADPGAIPFQYPQEFRLVINRRTASALKLTVPADLLLRADRVIE